MDYRESTFTNYLGQTLFYRKWLPEGGCKGRIAIVHGLAEHSGRYGPIAQRLAGKGYAVGIPDLSGHGHSPGRRCYIHDFYCFLDDIQCFLNGAGGEEDGPLFLLGHSMGGTIALHYALRNQENIQGLILSAPFIRSAARITPLHVLAAELLSSVFPRAGITRLQSAFLSRDEGVVSAYESDKLVYRGRISARLASGLVSAGRCLEQDPSGITLPVLILHGSSDRLSAPEGSEALYLSLGSPDRTLLRYDGLYHELFNEPEKEQVLTDVESWLAAHCW